NLLPTLGPLAAAGDRRRLTVGRYGRGTRRVEVVGGTGGWYKSVRGLVPLRWVFVRGRTGTHRDEHFDPTDPSLAPAALTGNSPGRWNSEATFREARSCPG